MAKAFVHRITDRMGSAKGDDGTGQLDEQNITPFISYSAPR